MILSVIKYPSPILNQVSEPVKSVEDVRTLAQNLLDTAKAEKAIGISAIQCGIPLQVIIVSANGKNFITMINPIILGKEGMEMSKEGCLSYANIVQVFRPKNATVRYLDLDGNEVVMTVTGMLKNCVIHEIEHLQGKGIWAYDKSKGY